MPGRGCPGKCSKGGISGLSCLDSLSMICKHTIHSRAVLQTTSVQVDCTSVAVLIAKLYLTGDPPSPACKASYTKAVERADLKGVELFPWQVPSHHFPHNDPKRVHICCLAELVIFHHLYTGTHSVAATEDAKNNVKENFREGDKKTHRIEKEAKRNASGRRRCT